MRENLFVFGIYTIKYMYTIVSEVYINLSILHGTKWVYDWYWYLLLLKIKSDEMLILKEIT